MGREKKSKFLKIYRDQMIEYLLIKTKCEDWHGVADAANDLREIDAELRGLSK